MRRLLSLFFCCFAVHAADPIHEYKLDNGLKLIVKVDDRAPVAISMLWYKVGAADERGGATGLAHALEHLMFKGTPKYPLGVFTKTIANIGGQLNAFTSSDYTAYFEKLEANKLSVAFELEADRMQSLLLDQDEFSKEMKVIMEERRLRTDDNPQALTFERFLATAQLSFAYQHPVIGWMSDLEALTVSDARKWYQRYYAPNNATLVVVGDVQPDEVFSLAKRYFGPIKKHTHYERKEQLEPKSLGSKQVEVHSTATIPILMLGYTVPSLKTAQQKTDAYALELISGILSAGDNARFGKNIIRTQRLASSLDVYYNLYSRYQPQLVIYGSPQAPHDSNELKSAILTELKRLQDEPISDEELQRIKTQIIAQKTFEQDSIYGQAMELGVLETVGLGFAAAEAYLPSIKAITPAQIQAVAKQYFNPEQLTEARLIPSASKE